MMSPSRTRASTFRPHDVPRIASVITSAPAARPRGARYLGCRVRSLMSTPRCGNLACSATSDAREARSLVAGFVVLAFQGPPGHAVGHLEADPPLHVQRFPELSPAARPRLAPRSSRTAPGAEVEILLDEPPREEDLERSFAEIGVD